MATSESPNRLVTVQHHVEDMRNLVMCKICLKPLYEPFILACGHTYCYGCLRSWFSGLESRRRKKNCPDCRAVVKLTPAPNYILRDLVHMFIGRAELLPEDETVDEHAAGKIVEADLLASDRDGEGLFQGTFKNQVHPLAAVFGPLRDTADGVYRCPACHWEIEDGACGQCGYTPGDDYADFSDEEDGESILSHGGGQSTVDEDTSDAASDYDSDIGIPPHFYAAHSLSDDVHTSFGMDEHSELEYDGPEHYGHNLDEDDMDGFIDDEEDDAPDELDDDGMGLRPFAHVPRPRRLLQIPDDDDDSEDEDESQALATGEREQYGWLGEARTLHSSENGESSSSPDQEDDDDDDEGEDQELGESCTDRSTNYDESDSDERSSTPIPIPAGQRRRMIVVSDDEDDEDLGIGGGLPMRATRNHEEDDETENGGEEDENEDEGEGEQDRSDSNDSTIPPQSSATRRQRLDNRRTRRSASSTWHAIARGRGSDLTDRRQRSNYLGSNRRGAHTSTFVC